GLAVLERHVRRLERTAAFSGEIELASAVRDMLADLLLRITVVGRGIDVVDPAVEHCAEELARFACGQPPEMLEPPQFHRAVAQPRDLEPGAAERRLRQYAHRFLLRVHGPEV